MPGSKTAHQLTHLIALPPDTTPRPPPHNDNPDCTSTRAVRNRVTPDHGQSKTRFHGPTPPRRKTAPPSPRRADRCPKLTIRSLLGGGAIKASGGGSGGIGRRSVAARFRSQPHGVPGGLGMSEGVSPRSRCNEVHRTDGMHCPTLSSLWVAAFIPHVTGEWIECSGTELQGSYGGRSGGIEQGFGCRREKKKG